MTIILRRFAFVLFALIGLPAWADPPTRVGRISLVEGAASLRHGEAPQWVPAPINYPVIPGDSLWVDRGGRAEIQIGGAELRLDAATLLTVLRMDDDATVLRIDQGVANLRVRFIGAPVQLVSAVGELRIREPGVYHVDSGRPDGPPTQLVMAVLRGEARFAGLRGDVELHAGQGAMVPPDQSQMSVVAVMPTPFDQWCEDRAMAQQMAQSAQYVSEEVVGLEDLDSYGRWELVPGYGMVWFPTRVEIGWAPYRYGSWAFVEPWGWTWIDEAPWGFAPFHYGRWATFEGRWAWIPGERHERPCYAPALVAFIGGGPGAGVGVSWVPLGPHEVFHPYYHVSDNYVRSINRPHVANVTQITVTNVTVNNFANRGAATATNANAFTGGQPVHRNLAEPGWQKGGQAAPQVMTNLNHLQPAAPQPAAQPAFHPPAAPQMPQPQAPQMPHPQPMPAAPVQPQPQPQVPQMPHAQPMQAAPAQAQPQMPRYNPPAPAPAQAQPQRPPQQQPKANPERDKDKDHH